jgi:hypothetical protein
MNPRTSSILPFLDQELNGVHTTGKSGSLPRQEFLDIQSVPGCAQQTLANQAGNPVAVRITICRYGFQPGNRFVAIQDQDCRTAFHFIEEPGKVVLCIGYTGSFHNAILAFY